LYLGNNQAHYKTFTKLECSIVFPNLNVGWPNRYDYSTKPPIGLALLVSHLPIPA